MGCKYKRENRNRANAKAPAEDRIDCDWLAYHKREQPPDDSEADCDVDNYHENLTLQ
jgi:hypothetical protein